MFQHEKCFSHMMMGTEGRRRNKERNLCLNIKRIVCVSHVETFHYVSLVLTRHVNVGRDGRLKQILSLIQTNPPPSSPGLLWLITGKNEARKKGMWYIQYPKDICCFSCNNKTDNHVLTIDISRLHGQRVVIEIDREMLWVPRERWKGNLWVNAEIWSESCKFEIIALLLLAHAHRWWPRKSFSSTQKVPSSMMANDWWKIPAQIR